MMQQTEPFSDTKLLTRQEVEREYGIPRHILAAAHDGAGPPRLKLGHRTIRFYRDDVEAWLHSKRIAPGASAGETIG